METVAEIRLWTERVLSEALGPPGPVALLDFPSHPNAGDSLIYLGTLAYLERLGYTPRFVSDQFRYDPDRLRSAHPEGPILMQGGGNYGDRYPGYQPHREAVVADFPDRRIVQLPVSLEYLDENKAAATHERIKQHSDYTLLVRERPSMERAAKLFPNVKAVYCPDLALGADVKGADPGADPEEVVWLLRTDSEGVARDLHLPEGSVVCDWELTRIDRFR